jgi:hypothetical protein
MSAASTTPGIGTSGCIPLTPRQKARAIAETSLVLHVMYGASAKDDAFVTCSPAGPKRRRRWKDLILDHEQDCYVANCTYSGDRATAANFKAMHFFGFDDVAHEAAPRTGQLPGDAIIVKFGQPDIVTETSPGNFQYLYTLTYPETDPLRAKVGGERIAQWAGSLTGNAKHSGSGETRRVYRLPGRNCKTIYGPNPPIVKLARLEPPKETHTAKGEFGIAAFTGYPGEKARDLYLLVWRDLGTVLREALGEDLDGLVTAAATRRTASVDDVRCSVILSALDDLNLTTGDSVDEEVDGHHGTKHFLICPWEADHTPGTGGPTSTFYSDANGVFHCSHSHCSTRKIGALLFFLDDELAARGLPGVAERYLDATGGLDPEVEAALDAATAAAADGKPGSENAIPLHEVFKWSDTVPDRTALRSLPWIASPYLMRGEIILLHGPGGHGKSLIIIYWCVALALGKPFGGMIPPPAPLRVLLANFEDREEALEQRIVAALDYFGATPADLGGRLRYVTLGTRCDATMFFAAKNSGQVTTSRQWQAWQWHHEQHRPDVSALDPFIAINAAGESENLIVRRIMTLLRTQVTLRHNCAGLLAHHDVKSGSDDAAADTVNARGAGDIINAARIEAAVKNMTEHEAENYGCNEDERRARFRLGSEYSKHNYSAAKASEWFVREPVTINGIEVVTCRPWTPPPLKANSGQLTHLTTLIEQATEPLSPRLSLNEPRSVLTACQTAGLVSKAAQKAALDTLLRRREIEVREWKSPKGPRQGLRVTATGKPKVHWL